MGRNYFLSLKQRANECNIVEPTMLGVVGNGVQVDVTMFAPTVYRGEDTTHKTLETMFNARAWPQQCWKSCENGRSQNKRNVGSCWVKTLIGFKLCATPCNRECKRTQQVTSSNIESCWPTMLRPFARVFSRFARCMAYCYQVKIHMLKLTTIFTGC